MKFALSILSLLAVVAGLLASSLVHPHAVTHGVPVLFAMPMLAPSARDLHVNQLLTNLSIAYRNAVYIADQLFPIVPVKKQSDIIPKYPQSYWFRDLARLRVGGQKSEGSGFTVDTTATYFCPRYSFRFEIPDEVRDNADDPFSMDRDGAIFVTDKLQMRREVAFGSAFFTTGVWAQINGAGNGDPTGGTDFTQWNDYGGSQPLVDVATYLDAIEGLIAREPNVMAIGKQSYVKLKWHPDLIDTIKYTQKGQLTPDLIASLFEVPKFLIGRGIYTTSAEGTAESSVTYSRIWGKALLALYVPAGPSLLTPSAGYTFVWSRVSSAIQYIKRMRDEEREVDIIEGNSYFTQAKVAQNAGFYMASLTA